MDLTLLIAFAFAVILLIVICTVFLRHIAGTQRKDTNIQEAATEHRQVRRVIGNRHVRQRINVQGQQYQDDEEDAGMGNMVESPPKKIGKKKQAKLELKAKEKVLKEAEMLHRKKCKEEEEEKQKERDRQREEEKNEELQREEAEKKERELKEQRELEAYLKMKEQMTVEKEGIASPLIAPEIKEDIVKFIMDRKCVKLNELPNHFPMYEFTDLIKFIMNWISSKEISNVIYTAEKLIYITEEEFEQIAKFIERRGQVNLTEVVDYCNTIFSSNST